MLCDMCSIDIRDGVVSAVHVSCVYRMCVLHTPIQYVCLVCVWSKCIDVFGMCVCVIVHVCCVVDTSRCTVFPIYCFHFVTDSL